MHPIINHWSHIDGLINNKNNFIPMSGKKTKSRHSLREIASELSQLAANLDNGVLQIGSHTVSVGDPENFKLKEKMKDGSISYEISFRLPLRSMTKPVTKTSQERPGAIKSTAADATVSRTNHAKTKHFGKPKKELGRLWKSLMQKVEARTALSAEDAASLKSICSISLYNDEPFHAAWLACCNKVNACLDAIRLNDFTRADQLVAEVKYMITSCHKKYK